MAHRRFRRDRTDKDFDAMIEHISKAKDQTTMSLSACLNRIRIRINSENYNDSVVEELRNDFDYVEKKLALVLRNLPYWLASLRLIMGSILVKTMT